MPSWPASTRSPRSRPTSRVTDYAQSRARTRQALEQIHSLRAALALPEEPEKGKPLDDVPPRWDQQHPNVKAAVGQFAINLGELGVTIPGYYDTPDQFVAEIRGRAPNGNIDALIARTVERSPGVASRRHRLSSPRRSLPRRGWS